MFAKDAIKSLAGVKPAQSVSESILADEDVITSLARRQAVQKDVQEALASLASTLSAASKPDVIPTVMHRFHERVEARAGVAKATEEARVEKEKRTLMDKACSERESVLCEEVRSLKNALNAADEIRQSIQREAEVGFNGAQAEITRERERARAAEKDGEEWHREAEAGALRLESMKAEVSALHEAMAGLHGEMGAVQRELDVAKTSQDKLTKDLAQAEGRAHKKQEALSAMLIRVKDAEKRIRKESNDKSRLSEELAKVSRQNEKEISALTAEVDRLKKSGDANRVSCDKLNATNRDLNALLQRLSAELEQLQEAAKADAKRVKVAEGQVHEQEERMHRLGEILTATESRLADAGRETNLVKNALSKVTIERQNNVAEIERQRGDLELLEREKRDLVLDVQERIKALKVTSTELLRYKKFVTEAERISEKHVSAKMASDDRAKKALDELNETIRSTVAKDKRIEALRLELSTLQRTLEQTSDTAKSRERESAQRLVQLSQANAKLSSEGANARARLAEVEDCAESSVHKLEDAQKTLAKSEKEVRRTSESIQRLEEELEVADTRWKAAQGQLAAAERRERRITDEAREHLRDALEAKSKELDAAVRKAEATNQRRSMEAEASQRAATRDHDRVLVSLREEAKKKLAEEAAKRVREVSEARRKTRALFGAFQALQGELRNSEAKGVSLERKMSQLSTRVNRSGSSSVASSERSLRGESETRGGEIGEIGGRSTDVVEAEMASLRRQLNAANQAREASEKGAAEARSRAEDEAKERSTLEESLCCKEGEMLVALERLEALKQHFHETKENCQDAQEDLEGLVRQRESEIEQLTRRNSVLSDALSRLTSSEADPEGAAYLPTELSISENVAASSISDNGMEAEIEYNRSPTLALSNRCIENGVPTGIAESGFPAILRIRKESCQSLRASSTSQMAGEGGRTSLFRPGASLSILVDGSAGFTPPAPLKRDNSLPHQDSRQRPARSNQCDSGSSSGRSFGAQDDAGKLDGPALQDGRISIGDEQERRRWKELAENNSSSDSFDVCRVDSKGNIDERVPTYVDGHEEQLTGHTTVATTGQYNGGRREETVAAVGDDGVSRGLSTAMTSGALPVLGVLPSTFCAAPVKRECNISHNRKRTNYLGRNTRQSQGGGEIDSNRNGVAKQSSQIADGRDTHDEGKCSNSWAIGKCHGINSVVERLTDRQADERGELARQQVDQALRERALKRRNSESKVATSSLRLESSLLLRPRDHNSEAGAEPTFQHNVHPEYAEKSDLLEAGSEGSRFRHPDPKRGGGSKQGLPGRGRRKSRERFPANGVASSSSPATTKTQAARVYGIPQKSR